MKEFSVETGEELLDDTAPGADQYIPALPIAELVASLTNPRKSFDATKLAELAESIKNSSLHSPILVRPLPGSRIEETTYLPHRAQGRTVRPTHEIIAGERRYRACKLAGLNTLPVLVRHLNDHQVLEVQLLENLQREDLSALEEAEGYEQLCTATGIAKEDVGAKIGKSRSYVYARLKLLDLSPDCKEALRAGQIDASRALLIARIPDTKLQQKALTEATRKGYNGDPISVRDLQTWLKRNVMLRLDEATFSITDSRLVVAAGSCKVCPKRTGANPDLFADVDGADICTDPPCFDNKAQAHRGVLLARAKSKGIRLIDGAEAKELCGWSGQFEGYSPLSQVREDAVQFVQGSGKKVTLGDLLGKDAPAPVLIENPRTKELIEAVPTDEAEAMLLARGLVKALEKKRDTKGDEKTLKYLQANAERDTASEVHQTLFDATMQAVLTTSEDMASTLLSSILRVWLTSCIDEYREEYMAMALGYTFANGEDEQDALTMCIRGASYATLHRAAIIVMANIDQHGYSDNEPLVLNALINALDVPTKELTKAATAKVRAKYAQRIKEVKADIDAQKEPVPNAPLAQPNPAPTLPLDKAKPKLKGKGKLSAQEATTGIAAAMQGLEQPATAPAENPQHKAWPLPKSSVAVKYRGPGGETWSGRGQTPKWVLAYEAKGIKREKMMVAE
jgi:ParB/RepB/Spo0J family partition protein